MAAQVVPQNAPQDGSDVGDWCLRRPHCMDNTAEAGAQETTETEKGTGTIREADGDRLVSTFACIRTIVLQTSCRITAWR